MAQKKGKIVMTNSITIRRPDDFHHHLRQGPMAGLIIDMLADQGWGRVRAMPNVHPAVTGLERAIEYSNELVCAMPVGGHQPTIAMTLELREDTSAQTIRNMYEHFGKPQAFACKTYPKNMTTNSEHGVSDYTKLYPALEVMQELNIPWLVHPEHPSENVPGLLKERKFILTLDEVVRQFPNLRIVVEHITDREMVEWVEFASAKIAATITAHHLALTLDDVIGYSGRFGYLMAPHNMCKPVAKMREDRDSLWTVISRGNRKFFFGSDSAAHPRNKKETAGCCAGCFTLPVMLPALCEMFAVRRELHRLEGFISRFGAEFFGVPLNDGTVTLVKEEWRVPREIPVPGTNDTVVPWLAGERLPWKLVPQN